MVVLHICSFEEVLCITFVPSPPQVLFDHDGCLRKYSTVTEILQEFYDVRLDLYRKRKEWLEGQLEAESARLDNQARFIMEKIEGKIIIGNALVL